MKPGIVVAFAAVLAVLASASPVQAQLRMPEPVDEAIVDALREDLAKAAQAYSDNEAAAADRLFDKALASPGFAVLDPGLRYRSLLRAGGAALEVKSPQKAHSLLVRACAFEQAEGYAWHRRLTAAYMIGDYVDSALSLAFIANRWPNSLDQIRAASVMDLSRTLEQSPGGVEPRMAMLTALFDANWTLDGIEPSTQWMDLVRFLIAKGDIPRATEIAARIDAPEIVLGFRVDKRFDGLTSARRGSFDVPRTMQRERARLDALKTEHPDRLAHVADALAIDVRDGHAERALTSVDKVIARVSADGATAYSDIGAKYSWVLQVRADALQRLGRWDEAVNQLRKAARRPEDGDLNVSQTLGLARLLARLERTDDAEEATEDLGAMSPFGRMHLALTRVIVASIRGDRLALEKQLDAMRTDRVQSMGAYQAALVQADRIDAAAALLIDRLRNEDWRSDALQEMQTYIDIAQAPRDKLHMERWRAILARNDVQEALGAVGRIESAPFDFPLL